MEVLSAFDELALKESEWKNIQRSAIALNKKSCLKWLSPPVTAYRLGAHLVKSN